MGIFYICVRHMPEKANIQIDAQCIHILSQIQHIRKKIKDKHHATRTCIHTNTHTHIHVKISHNKICWLCFSGGSVRLQIQQTSISNFQWHTSSWYTEIDSFARYKNLYWYLLCFTMTILNTDDDRQLCRKKADFLG